MKLFTCHTCNQLIFFENVSCTRCGHTLAYLPDRGVLSALAAAGPGTWEAQAPAVAGARYRLCANYTEHAVCNWAVPADDPERLCRACRLNDIVPNLSEPGSLAAWHRLEVAKRRLIYSLLELGLPLDDGLSFSFMRDGTNADQKVWTGHHEGVITINIAEADDPFREKMRVQLGEPYRTLLGHFRHEIGHYYWNRLIRARSQEWLPRFRELFGDETADYGEALKRNYSQGAPADWGDRYVSAYASMHPFEDWAETWAHYLHMTDTLETAQGFGLSLRPAPVDSGAKARVSATRVDRHSFEDLMNGWIPLTIALNSLNRSMGLPDSYPFVLSSPALAKLRFVHEVVEAAGTR